MRFWMRRLKARNELLSGMRVKDRLHDSAIGLLGGQHNVFSGLSCLGNPVPKSFSLDELDFSFGPLSRLVRLRETFCASLKIDTSMPFGYNVPMQISLLVFL